MATKEFLIVLMTFMAFVGTTGELNLKLSAWFAIHRKQIPLMVEVVKIHITAYLWPKENKNASVSENWRRASMETHMRNAIVLSSLQCKFSQNICVKSQSGWVIKYSLSFLPVYRRKALSSGGGSCVKLDRGNCPFNVSCGWELDNRI